jgi:peptidyl-prolyl cis-trans isomerase A (cyclophilin A)
MGHGDGWPGLSGIDSLGLPVIKSVKVLEKLDPTHMVALQLREHKLETGTPYFVFRGPDFTIAILAWKEPLKAMAIRRHQSGLFVVVMVGVGVCACLSAGRVHAQSDDKHPVVILDTSFGPITIELDQEKAPITVENFLKYVDDGFYDGMIFHRVIPRFMIQGGGFDYQMQEKTRGQKGKIKNESSNGLSNVRGTIAMARTGEVNSAQNQFFINHGNNPGLDYPQRGGYAVFGKVIDGMDVVDKIANVKTTVAREGRTGQPFEDVPAEAVIIKSARRKAKK